MMHKAWSSIEEVPYCFSGSSVKFLGHTTKKSSILTRIDRFRTLKFEFTDGIEMMHKP